MLVKDALNSTLLKINSTVNNVSITCFQPIVNRKSLYKKNSARLQRRDKLIKMSKTVKSKFPTMKITNKDASHVTPNVMILTNKIVFSFLKVFRYVLISNDILPS